MLFNSFEFIFVFLPLVFVIYFFLLSRKLILGAKAWLVLSSLFFYSWWNPIYLPLILTSVFINYALGTGLGKSFDNPKSFRKIRPKSVLTIGIIFNLALLGYFKYTNFFVSNLNYFLEDQIPSFDIALPLAISFFTFQQIAYLVDSYRGETKEYDLLNYMFFVTFFPQLIAGPIVHHKQVMPQIGNIWNLRFKYKNIILGLVIFSLGIFKKVVIADNFAIFAKQGFDVAESLNFVEAWVTSLSYTFQLYFDFSGYTDMAIGAALFFNIKLPINFNSPYKALNIQDFWRRWHITLSQFLRDYVYIPLGGNRKGEARTYFNLFMTFFLGGLWHGASWMFVIWGIMHGLGVVIHRAWQKTNFKLYKPVSWLITFLFVNLAWVFFRANEMKDAIKVIKGMINVKNIVLPGALQQRLSFLNFINFGPWLQNVTSDSYIVIWILLTFIIVLKFKNSTENYLERRISTSVSLASGVLLAVAVGNMIQLSEFLYFNF